MNIEAYLEEKKAFFETEFYKILPQTNEISKRVFDAVNYSAKAPGKRIRPILIFAANEVFNGNIIYTLPYAFAVECIHTYSLIHDDLPAMDNDDFRRGIPTCHRAFDEATAILAGDALLNLAFEILSDINFVNNLPLDKHLKCMHILARAAGIHGMIGGQMADILMEGEDEVKYEDLLWIHAHKTGAIINACLEIGAIIGNAKDNEISSIKEYGKNIGLAFQVRDDLLNVEGDPKVTGKPIGSDARRKKLTFLRIFTPEKTREILDNLVNKAVDAVKPFGERANILIKLAEYIAKREK